MQNNTAILYIKLSNRMRHNRLNVLNHPEDKTYITLLQENTWYMHEIAKVLKEWDESFNYDEFIKDCKSPLE